jgi:hypothetical protein
MLGMLQLGLALLPPTQSDPRTGAQQWSLGLPVAVHGHRRRLVMRTGAKPQLLGHRSGLDWSCVQLCITRL